MMKTGFGPGHTPHVAPCEVCTVPTVYTHDGGARKGLPFRPRWICQPCRIAESACSRIHGIESEQREKLVRIDAIHLELDAAYRERSQAQNYGFEADPLNRHIRRLTQEKERLERETAHLPTDPLGLERISDDRDFIERFLEGFPEARPA